MKGWLCYTSGKMAVSHSCLYHERGTDLGGNVPCANLVTILFTSVRIEADCVGSP
jgi:hypothetical protein